MNFGSGSVAVVVLTAATVGFFIGRETAPSETVDHTQVASLESLQMEVTALRRSIENLESQRFTQVAPSPIASNSVSTQSPTKTQSAERVALKSATQNSDSILRKEEADALISRAMGHGRWTDTEVQAMREILPALDESEQTAVLARLVQAINSQELRLDVSGGGPF